MEKCENCKFACGVSEGDNNYIGCSYFLDLPRVNESVFLELLDKFKYSDSEVAVGTVKDGNSYFFGIMLTKKNAFCSAYHELDKRKLYKMLQERGIT